MRPKKQRDGTIRPGLSLTQATRIAGTTRRTTLKNVGSAITKDERGRYRASRRDRIHRRMHVQTTSGDVVADIPSSTQASLNARHANAVKHYRDTGDASVLAAFRGKRAGGHELETDPAALDARARADDLDVEELYERKV